MGNGAWNDNTYRAAATFRRARGTRRLRLQR